MRLEKAGRNAGDTGITGSERWWTPEVRRELQVLYGDVDREIGALGVVCWRRGDCCDFTRCEHVLFASALEIAFVREAHRTPFAPGDPLCPFWRERRCTLRERRPLGCRTYFCDGRFRAPLEELHERVLARLRTLAARHGAPWGYRPFVAALRTGGEDGGRRSRPTGDATVGGATEYP